MIFVPRAGIIWAMGDVARPGGYMISNNEGTISVLELVARAGGTPPSAVPSHAKLIRKSGSGYIEMPLQLSAMQKGKRADMQLQPDDIVYVPFSYMRNLAESSSGIVSSLGSAAVYKF
jgi:polysaccharide export outer membrane protein